MNSAEESTGQRTEPFQNKNESAGEPGNTKDFSSMSQRHPNPRCSPGRAAKEGGQRGRRAERKPAPDDAHVQCPGLRRLPGAPAPASPVCQAGVGASPLNPRGSETERCLTGELQAIGGGKKKTVFWLG